MIDEISIRTFNLLCDQARQSPRRRQHLNLHESYSDPCQRFLNAISHDSYIRPHRHRIDPKIECLVALQGTLGVIIFGDSGDVIKTVRIGSDGASSAMGVQIFPEQWHTVVAITNTAVLLEIKDGPFDQDSAKEFASWAPAEGLFDAGNYLKKMLNIFKL